MAACGSLQHIFEKPLPESPTLFSSCSQLHPVKTSIAQNNTFTEIFGELHFKDNSSQSSSSSSPSRPSSSSSFPISFFSSSPPSYRSSSCSSIDLNSDSKGTPPRLENRDTLFSAPGKSQYAGCQKKDDGFTPMNYESLQLCTEGLGFESSDDVEDLKNHMMEDWKCQEEKVSSTARQQHSVPPQYSNLGGGEFKRSSRSNSASFPPPISCIGKGGRPWVCFKSYRQDGRFVLKQVKIPNQELLHACREDGRLTLHFVQPNDDINEEEPEEDEDENYEDDDNDEQEYEDEDDDQEEGNEQLEENK